LVLDSVLEAVDAHTDAHIWDHVLGQNGILKNHTRILVTHAVHHLSEVDRICYLEGGRLAQIGTHEELLSREGLYQRLIVEFANLSTEKRNGSPRKYAAPKEVTVSSESDEADGTLVQSEAVGYGRVSGKTYSLFFSYAGIHRLIILVCMTYFTRGLQIGGQFWLSHWINSDDAAQSRKSAFYIGIYSIFPIATAILGPTLVALAGTYVILPATTIVYDKMVNRVLRAPLSWFHTTPTARITNRLTSDSSNLDYQVVGLLGETPPTEARLSSIDIHSYSSLCLHDDERRNNRISHRHEGVSARIYSHPGADVLFHIHLLHCNIACSPQVRCWSH
jgi:ABC-type multidrug transport system fused ATPase/permease subunit